MNFNHLEEKIEKIALQLSFAKLDKAAQELSLAYRAQSEGIKQSKPFMSRQEHKIAYLAPRMPSTYAAICEVLSKIQSPIHSLLDLGSGPGTAFWSALHQFSGLNEVLLIEKDTQMIQLGKKFLEGLKNPYVQYEMHAIDSYIPKKSYDLVTAAYFLSELHDLPSILQKLWNATGQYFCIIEPGTPYGFHTLLQVRKFLIQQNAYILAPCTHEKACPWENGNDWCHFSTRLDRTALQGRLKSATLGYEDEKYSYLIASKTPVLRNKSRVVKTPVKRSGFVQLSLCNQNGLQDQIFSKKDKEKYLQAKNLEWGDSL